MFYVSNKRSYSSGILFPAMVLACIAVFLGYGQALAGPKEECTENLLSDGGFEASVAGDPPGSPPTNAFWSATSTNFGSPLCSVGSCTPRGHTGSWWAWFGGTYNEENASLSQNVVIPSSASATWSFYLEIEANGATGYLEARVDDSKKFLVTQDSGGFSTYAQVNLDMSSYADGASHEIEFRCYTAAGTGLGFLVDDVCLVTSAGSEGEGAEEGEGAVEGEGAPEGEGAEEGEGEEDKTPPTGTLLINEGASWANTVYVGLNITADDGMGSGVTDMRLMNTGGSWGEWEPFTGFKSWMLAEGPDGIRQVEMQLRDARGNVSDVPVLDTIGLDTILPTGTLLINGGDLYTPSPTVTLTMSTTDESSGVTQMRFSTNNSDWGEWMPYETPKVWTLSDDQGQQTLYVQFKDAADNISSGVIYAYIYLDTEAPEGTLAINEGAEYTNSTSATLHVQAMDEISGVAEMRFSNDTATWSEWTPFETYSAWNIPSGDGLKTVYGEIKDNVGYVASFNDAIYLDTELPSGSVQINDGGEYTNTPLVTLWLNASDTVSGVTEMNIANEGGSFDFWQPYESSQAWVLEPGEGFRLVGVLFRDGAGNVASFGAGITVDQTPPTGTIQIENGADRVFATQVMLNLAAEDGPAGSGVAHMQFSNDGATWSGWQPFADTAPWTLASGDGIRTVHAQFKDGAGNESTDIVFDTITLQESGYEGEPPCEDDNDPSGTIVYFAGFEDGLDGFTLYNDMGLGTGLWQRFSSCHIEDVDHDSAYALWYGDGITCTYDTGASKGYIMSPLIDLRGISGTILLSFRYYLETEDHAPDRDTVSVSLNFDMGGARIADNYSNSPSIARLCDPSDGWKTAVIDISAYAGITFNISAYFDTVDAMNNDFGGFYIDDITIVQSGVEGEEGEVEGEGSEGEGESEGGDEDGFLTADQNHDHLIGLSELLRVIQFFNSSGFHCEAGTEDGYAPGTGDQSCAPYASDYNPADWAISLSELLRVIQFFNSGGYHYCPEDNTEDGFCPGLA